MDNKKVVSLILFFVAVSFSIPSNYSQTSGFSDTKKLAKPEIRNLKAQELPMLVMVHADWCPACRNIEPTWNFLKHKYQGKVQFILFDISTANTKKEAQETALKLGIEDWFNDNRSRTSVISLMSPSKNVIKTYINESDRKVYQNDIDSLLH